MKILNLIIKDGISNSDISCVISHFPDGQQQVKINSGAMFQAYPEPVLIKARLNDFRDIELIACSAASLRNLGVKEIHLHSPYFLGSRSDRNFEHGSNNYLKQVICPMINALNFESVTVLDPHSDCLEMGLNNFKRIDNYEFVKWALMDINSNPDAQEKTIFISPDGGALKKIYKVADYVNFKGDVITCSKYRDNDGNLTRVNVPLNEDMRYYENKAFVIIDDICDGGATFINIAKEIKQNLPVESKIFLIVTHGIFSKGLLELNEYFEKVYTTNSYKDMPQFEESLVKQLNVFN